jgi:hypothetical protein
VVQPGSLRGQVTGDLDIKPILNLGRQMNDFEGHGGIPVQFRGQTGVGSGAADVPGLGWQRLDSISR